MQITKDHQVFNNEPPIWDFIAEYSIGDVAQDEYPEAMLTDGSLIKTLHESGLPPEYIIKIYGLIARTVREAKSQFERGKPNSLIKIRMYCQRRVIHNPRQTKYSRQIVGGQPGEPSHQVLDPETKMSWGWGCFVVKRGRDFPTASQEEPIGVVELYLYREGE
jgi:hypothetical protein